MATPLTAGRHGWILWATVFGCMVPAGAFAYVARRVGALRTPTSFGLLVYLVSQAITNPNDPKVVATALLGAAYLGVEVCELVRKSVQKFDKAVDDKFDKALQRAQKQMPDPDTTYVTSTKASNNRKKSNTGNPRAVRKTSADSRQ